MYNMLTWRVLQRQSHTYSIVTISVASQPSQVLPQPSQEVPQPTQGVLQPIREVTQPTQEVIQLSQVALPPTSGVNNSNPAVVNEKGMLVHVIIATTVN